MRNVAPKKRMALLACMVHVARTRARDDLAEMFCKRMASVTKLAKAELAEIREREGETGWSATEVERWSGSPLPVASDPAR